MSPTRPWARRVGPLLLGVLICGVAGRPEAQSRTPGLSIVRAAETVGVAAPDLAFIQGEPLAILKDGRSLRVDLDLQVLARPGGDAVARSRQTFVLSYDLWEERFAATRIGPPVGTAEHAAASAAEAWCVAQLAVPISALGAVAGQPFWIRLGYRILDADRAEDDDGRPGFTLQALIDALSRRRRASEWTDSVEAGPFRLAP